MKRNLFIVLRTCTSVDMLNNMGAGRYINVPKHQLVNTCVSSLINSINQVKGHDIQLAVLDDHSAPEAVADIESIISQCKFPAQLIPVEDGTGNAYTMGRVYELIEEYSTDLWYHVEDDYLHRPEAIQDMIDSVTTFEQNTGKMVAINPHDDVWRYVQEVYPSTLLHGPKRHYRTVRHTTYTCLASRDIYEKYRSHFQDVVSMTKAKAPYVENKSINLVWNKSDVALFSPIPGLAFHIMDPSGMDPYVDINALWDSIPKLWKEEERSKVAIVSMANDSHKELADETWPNKAAYAEEHGYEAYLKTSGWTKTPIHFEKLVFMLETMDKHPHLDWVWWLDNDAIITNFNIELDDIIDNDYHVIITVDVASLNAGSFMVRNSLQGRNWLKHILSLESHYKDNRWPEQQPMTDTYVSFKDIIKVVPQRTMNSYDYRIYGVPGIDLLGELGQYQDGDFVFHWPAIPNATRIQLSKQLSPHHRK